MNSTLKKIGAILLIASLLGIVALTLYFAITGSDYFIGMLALMIFYPIFLWAMSFLYKWTKNKTDKH